MTRNILEPTATPVTSPDRGTRYRHPAFGQLQASRVSYGNAGTNLYGSDLRHSNVMVVRINTSEMTRTLSRDWHYAPDSIIEVMLSEAQWATFVSTPNSGQGVPCTITRRDGASVPGIPDRVQSTEFKNEVRETMARAVADLDQALAALEDAKTVTERRRIHEQIRQARQHLTSNLPFVADQFDRHVEKTVEAAKVEAVAYLTNAITRAGLTALGAEPPAAIEPPRHNWLPDGHFNRCSECGIDDSDDQSTHSSCPGKPR